MSFNPIYIYCEKRNQRLSINVCLFRKCENLGEEGGKFFCKFVPEVEKKIKRRKPNEPNRSSGVK
jgi:hypothetical protein